MEKYTIPEYKVHVDQLLPGVFIRLENLWFDHPFLSNKFKIMNMDMVRALKEVGISEVICVPEKSDKLPRDLTQAEQESLAKAPAPAGEVSAKGKSSYADRFWQVKKERIDRLKQKRDSIERCARKFENTVAEVPNLMAGVMGGSPESVAKADEMVSLMVEVFLSDTDAIVHLMENQPTDEVLHLHALNVSVLALMVGKQLSLPVEEMNALGLGALFHDLGKNRIEKKVLRKPPPHTPAERQLIQRHPQWGVEMLSKAQPAISKEALKIVFQHHERMNGKGYPLGLEGAKISRLARITAIADVYDNLCNNIYPEKSLTPYQALSFIFAKLKTQLDMNIFSAMIKCLGIYPPGTVIKLSNDSLGIVIAVNPRNPLKPSVLIYDPQVPKAEAIIYDMEEAPDLSVVQSIHPSRLPKEIYSYLSPRARVSYYMDNGKDSPAA